VPKTDVTWTRTKLTVLVAGLACCGAAIRADGPGHSFASLTSPYTQELYGVTASPVVIDGADGFVGGVAFAPDGDVWGAECLGSQYHRFDRQGKMPDGHGGTVRQESVVDVTTYAPAPVGCGLVNHPEPYQGINTVWANTLTGLWPLEADTGLPILGGPINSSSVNAGNGRGIDVDPIVQPTNHIVYAGADCDPSLRASVACTLWDYNMTAGDTFAFARFHRAATESIESVYFSPDGSSVFVSYRDTEAGTQGLAVIGRRAALLTNRNTIDDTQVLGRIAMSAMPQGLAFRAASDFAVTLNEDGTMTRLAFPAANFSGVPAQSTFASGGFLGGLLRVGADGCIYAPQGRMVGGSSGVRYGDDAVAPTDSIVRICGGFVPSIGVANASWSPEPGSLSGAAFGDWDRDGVRDPGEPGVSGVTISLSGPATASAVTDGSGGYALVDVPEGLYSVSAPATVGELSGNPTPLAAQVAAGQMLAGIDFPYTESTPPVCTTAVQSGTPNQVTLTLRDSGSGVRRVVVSAVSNFQVSVAGGAAVTSPVTVDFPTPAAGDVNVTATRSTAAQAANVELQVVDAFGTQTTCMSSVPASTTEPPPPPPPGGDTTITEELKGWGHHHVVVADKLPNTMRYITIRNSQNGLHSVSVHVNHHWYHVGPMRDGQVKKLDVGRSLVAGKKNRIALVGWGRKHDSAVVTISAKQ